MCYRHANQDNTVLIDSIWGSRMQATALLTNADDAVEHGRMNSTTARARRTTAYPASARSALRSATHDIHQRMHHHPALSRLAAGTISRDEYRRVLARSYGFYIIAEPALGFAGKLTDCLFLDLAELGMMPAAIAVLPRWAASAFGQHPSALIGARYVLLGASLGGKVMARAIAGRTGSDGAMPVRFLTGMGENDWKAFASRQETDLPDAASRKRAATAASAMFAAYENWMAWRE